MANKNCLEGMQCPKCGSSEPFDIEVETTVRMTDDGADYLDQGGNLDWDNHSICECCRCHFGGTVADFKCKDLQVIRKFLEWAATKGHHLVICYEESGLNSCNVDLNGLLIRYLREQGE